MLIKVKLGNGCRVRFHNMKPFKLKCQTTNFNEKSNFLNYPPASKASRVVPNFTERKNPHTSLYLQTSKMYHSVLVTLFCHFGLEKCPFSLNFCVLG